MLKTETCTYFIVIFHFFSFSINHENVRSWSCVEMTGLIINTKRRRAFWKDEWTLMIREISSPHITGHASQIISSEESLEALLVRGGAVFMSSFLSVPLKPSEVSPEAPQSEFIKVRDSFGATRATTGSKKKNNTQKSLIGFVLIRHQDAESAM